MSNETFAIITPSYAPDFERCRLLCESIKRLVSTPLTHYIIVDDARDYRLFSCLENNHTRVLQKRDILPAWIHRIPGVRKFWFNWRGRPIRGWIFQQLAKIAVAQQAAEDVVFYVDSDTTFVRPLDLERYMLGDKLRLYSEPGGNPEDMQTPHAHWHRVACDLLGLEPTPMPAPDYIHNAVSWRPENVRAMCKHIEKVSGRGWIQTLASQWQFSEYILYGTFVERVLGAEAAGHYSDPAKITLDYWTPRPLSDQELREFVAAVEPQHIGVMLSAKAKMSPERYSEMLELIEASEQS